MTQKQGKMMTYKNEAMRTMAVPHKSNVGDVGSNKPEPKTDRPKMIRKVCAPNRNETT